MFRTLKHLFMVALIGQNYGITSSQNLEQCGVSSLTGMLDSITYLVSNVKDQLQNKVTKERSCLPISPGPTDCAQVFLNGHRTSGVYRIWPTPWETVGSLNVYCDMNTDGGGWTVIQRRGDYGNPTDYFYKPWQNYKQGFGNIAKDFWLGNDWIFAITNQGNYSIRFDLKDKENNTRYAIYQNFWIDNESHLYRLHVNSYSGDAGDSFGHHSGYNFSTKDRDHDTYDTSCAQKFKGGWWYLNCHGSNLNGLYLNGEHESYADGINWKEWKGYHYSLTEVEMKIRPLNFDPFERETV
ncbi:techylectin-5A-like isoform X2 [Limulus polyphemus]|nr:techylectin-5A-like isoform X2 [Limulus polyphemus]XP_022238361.1 techylectin-5A-like isoform X2 [Limulus polyphemus]